MIRYTHASSILSNNANLTISKEREDEEEKEQEEDEERRHFNRQTLSKFQIQLSTKLERP
eukprot:9431218-Pyramimonas_sp.AAC.1